MIHAVMINVTRDHLVPGEDGLESDQRPPQRVLVTA